MITPMLFNINVKKNNISRYLPKKKYLCITKLVITLSPYWTAIIK